MTKTRISNYFLAFSLMILIVAWLVTPRLLAGTTEQKTDALTLKIARKRLKSKVANVKLDSSILRNACIHGHTEILKGLLKKNVNINVKDHAGWTPLHHAVFFNRIKIVKLLLANGADVNIKAKHGLTPLMLAKLRKHSEIIKLLSSYSKKQDLNLFLAIAASKGNIAEVKRLLKKGANVNSMEPGIGTPLHVAAFEGHPRVIKVLIANGANVEAKNKNGSTPLYMAAAANKPQIVKILLDHGAKKDIANKTGQTPQSIAELLKHKEILKLFVVNKNPTQIIYATMENRVEMVKTLLAKGADVNAKDKKGYSSLHWAAFTGHVELSKILIKNGAKVNIVNNKGESPLFSAISSNKKEIVKLLIANGANVNLKAANKYTPLLHAKLMRDKDIEGILLAHGAKGDFKEVNEYLDQQVKKKYNNLKIKIEFDPKPFKHIAPNNLSVKQNKLLLKTSLKEKKSQLMKAYRQGKRFAQFKRYPDAIVQYNKALLLAPEVFGQMNISTATLFHDLALLYVSTKQYAKAEPLYMQSLKILESKLGNNHLEVAVVLSDLAELYRLVGRYSKAESLLLRSLKISEAELGKNHSLVINSLNRLAGTYVAMGQYPKAKSLFLQTLHIIETKLGKNHLDVATSLGNLVGTYIKLQQYEKAEALYFRCLKIQKEKLGEDHPIVIKTTHNLAVLYASMGLFSKAEPLLLKILERARIKHGNEHLNVATILSNLATIYIQIHKYDKAELLLLQSMLIVEKKLGHNHSRLASNYCNLGSLYCYMGKFPRAEPLLLQSLKIRKARLGKNHPEIAISYNNLGGLYFSMKKYDKAEEFLLQGLNIDEAIYGKDHFNVTDNLCNIVILYATRGKWKKAISYGQRWRRIERRFIARTLPALSEREQISFLRNKIAQSFQSCLSLSFSKPNDVDIVSTCAEWLLNGKALGLESMAECLRIASKSNSPDAKRALQELREIRSCMSQLAFSAVKKGNDLNKKINDLRHRQDKQLKLLSSLVRINMLKDPWVSLDDIQKAIPVDAFMIDIARLKILDCNSVKMIKQWKPARYVAWVIPPAGKEEVKLVDLGPADKIDKAVAAYRDTLPATASQIAAARKDSSTIQAAGKALAKLIWQPLVKEVGSAKQILLSPDGQLWLVPWAALPDKNGKFLLEGRNIRYLVSGRYLIAKKSGKHSHGGMMFADPDYDLKPDTAGSKASPATRSGEMSNWKWSRLPGTAKEAQQISTSLGKYVKGRPAVYTGAEAREKVFKIAKSPQVIVLSTHGFALPEQKIISPPKFGGMMGSRGIFIANSLTTPRPAAIPQRHNPGQNIENPLLRCGLVLAGANNHNAVRNANDGILTGLEIVGTDLSGTNIIVLSACETGVGKIVNGEGVSGIRQSFQLAGVKSVVATLWKIPDKETVDIMSAFWDNLASGQSKSDALRNAQLKMIAKLRSKDGTANPFFWAAFTLTGDD